MNLVWGHKGPYFHAPCQRNRFPSLVDELGEDGDKLVAHLGISNMPDMGARLKRGRKHTKSNEQHAANNVKNAAVPLHKLFRSKAHEFRRGLDKYTQVPLYDPYEDKDAQPFTLPHHRKLLQSIRTAAPRQAGEPPYTGNCDQCRRVGSNDVANDFQGRRFLRQAFVLGQFNLMALDGQQQQQNELAPNLNRNRNQG